MATHRLSLTRQDDIRYTLKTLYRDGTTHVIFEPLLSAGTTLLLETIESLPENVESIKGALKEYVLKEFLPGEDPEALADDTPLITGGIMDSIATIKFSLFVEEQYGVELQAHELSADYIDTLSGMATVIQAKHRG